MRPPTIYRCDGCGGVFASDLTEDEALADMTQKFPGLTRETAAVLCEDCYRRAMLLAAPQ